MVNRGPSRGCATCKKRRVKCDETKPICKECIRIGRDCAGYGKKAIRVRFKDETARYLEGPTGPTTTTKITSLQEPIEGGENHMHGLQRMQNPIYPIAINAGPQPKQEDAAVAFFLRYVTDIGRNMESTRGCLEFVRPVLARESHQSALSSAVRATAVKLWVLLRPSNDAVSSPIQLHNEALTKLQHAINSPTEQGKDATILAALMLQHYDTLAAVFDRHKARNTHRVGALALLKQKNVLKNSEYRGYFLGNLFHSNISFCIKHKIPLTGGNLDWFRSEVIPALPSNPSSLLDIIGISISTLQRVLVQNSSTTEDLSLSKLQDIQAIVDTVDAQLQSWLTVLPELWQPRAIQREDATTSSFTTYYGSCDIYPNVQIANIWNVWRMYRLIVEQTRFVLISQTGQSRAASHVDDSALPTDQILNDTRAYNLREVESIVDSICRSIPFYLGNSSQPLSFSDIDDSRLELPSYHDLPPADAAFVAYRNSDHYASKVDHYRHTILHGPLHALTVLSSLMGQLSEEQCAVTSQGSLCDQKQFIDEQFHRCLYLLKIVPRITKVAEQSQGAQSPNSRHQASPPPALAHAVRQTLSTVAIL